MIPKWSFLLFLTAAVVYLPGCKEENLKLTDVIRFDNPNAESLSADNISTLKITAIIPGDATDGNRSIVFTTDAGEFSNDTNTVTETADPDGKATVYLHSGQFGVATVKATVSTFSATKTVNFTTPDPNSIVRFGDGLASSVPADGVSTLAISAVINNNAPAALRTVTFTTDAGTFANGQTSQVVTSDATGIASTTLKSALEGKASVAITNQNVTRNMAFTFSRALPDVITLSSDFVLKAGIDNKITIQSQLSRIIGKPSPNFAIDYTATDNQGQGIGLFKNATISNAGGQVTVDFSAGTSAYRGPVTITARVREAPTVTASMIVTVEN